MAAGDADHAAIFYIEIERLLASNPDQDREIKGDQRATVEDFVDIARRALDEFSSVDDPVLALRGDELRPLQEMHALGIEGGWVCR